MSSLSDFAVTSPMLRQVTEAREAVSITGGVLALNMVYGISSATLNANVTSLTLANNAASASACHCHTLELTGNGTAYSVAWPAGDGVSTLLFKWAGGVAPTLTSTSGKRDVFFFKSVSQYLFDAFIVGQNL